MRIRHTFLPLLLSQFLLPIASGQVFVNLDFESATVPQNQPNGIVNESDALPGWAADVFPFNHQSTVGFNSAMGGILPLYSNISLLGTNSGYVIDGTYSVMLEDVGPGVTTSVSIDQTGVIPVGSQSIWFKAQPGFGSLIVNLGNQNIPVYAESQGPNYTLYAGDVSAFAGQTVKLAFSVLQSSQANTWMLDSVEFSPSPVPEPSIFGLLGIGIAFFIWHFIQRFGFTFEVRQKS
jgi:hypothetical protein